MPARGSFVAMAVTFTRRLPSPLIVPAMTFAPFILCTGSDSPVIVGFIDIGMSINHFTIRRDTCTWADEEEITMFSVRRLKRFEACRRGAWMRSKRYRAWLIGASSLKLAEACCTDRISSQ